MGWSAVDLPLFLALPVLLIFSGFFSGTETAFFDLRPHERSMLARRADSAARSAALLLAQPRLLLVTLLLGNMIVNTLYFVISSALLLRLEDSPTGALVAALSSAAFLLALILLGEIAPKMVAAYGHLRWIGWSAIPMFTFMQAVRPLTALLSRAVVEPLLRLIATDSATTSLSTRELADVLEWSGRQGALQPEELAILRHVVGMSDDKVRQVMTPRVHMPTIPLGASRSDALALIRNRPLPFIALRGEHGDDIVGLLDVKRFLLREAAMPRDCAVEPTFIPEQATVDQLLEHFRSTHTKLAVVVDEYGQVAGQVTLYETLAELLEMRTVTPAALSEAGIVRRADNLWELDGDCRIRTLADAFNFEIDEDARYSTVGGLILDRLGRIPEVGESVQFGGWNVTVTAVDEARIASLHLERRS